MAKVKAKAVETETETNETQEETIDENASLKFSVGDTELEVERKFKSGHVLSAREALALSMFYITRFVGNMRSDIERREKSYTRDELLEKYSNYQLGAVRVPGESALERMRFDAALRTLSQIFEEHNDALKRGDTRTRFKGKPVSMPTGKGSKEVKEAWVAKILTNPEYAENVQANLDAIQKERGVKREKMETAPQADVGADL